MIERSLQSPISGITLEPWQVYYLRKKQLTERTLNQFIRQSAGLSLTPNAYAAVEHGVLLTSGKRVRPVLTHLVHDLVGGKNPYINKLAILAELPHRGSLLEDDIDDHAKQRDGKPPAFYLFGKDATMAACAFLYKSPRLILDSLPVDDLIKQRMLEEYARLSNRAREGQRKDVQWGKENYIPTVEEYLKMCEEKCAAFEYAIRVGAEFGGASTQQVEILVEAGNKAATAFQLVDDLLSLRQGSDDYGSDISEGKKTLPVIYASHTGALSRRLLDILSSGTDDIALTEEAILILNRTGGIKRSEETVQKLAEEAIILVQRRFTDSKFRKILFSIINYGVTRSE